MGANDWQEFQKQSSRQMQKYADSVNTEMREQRSAKDAGGKTSGYIKRSLLSLGQLSAILFCGVLIKKLPQVPIFGTPVADSEIYGYTTAALVLIEVYLILWCFKTWKARKAKWLPDSAEIQQRGPDEE